MPLINLITHVRFDFGAISALPEELERLGIRHPLIVSDPGVVRAGCVEKACAWIKGAPCSEYFDTPQNPTEDAVEAALKIYNEERCDGIVAIGGGSSMDLAKAVGLLATHDGVLMDYDVTTGGHENVGPIAPVIAVPTTAGTGTEVSIGAVILLRAGHKGIVDSRHLVPAGVICDPEMTLSLPPSITAETGIDALSHCIEGYLSNIDNPPLEAIALDGARRIARNLRAAVKNGGDRTARWEMMMGALEGGMSMLMELGAAHAMANYVGYKANAAHGRAIAVALGPSVAFAEAAAPEKVARIREALGVAPGADIARYFDDLCRGIGLPTRLSELGLSRDDLGPIAESCAKSFFNMTAPRKASVQDYEALLVASY